jgi:hypothetical protein
MFQILRKKRVSIPLAVVAVLAVGGIAYAYWTTTGSGTATGTTGTNTALTITQDGTVTAMTPGSAAQAVNYTIANGASTPQYVTTVTIAVTGVTVTGSDPETAAVGCSADDFSLVQPTAVGLDLPVGDTSFTQVASTTYQNRLSGTVRMLNTTANQDGCKNTTVHFSMTAV